MAKKTKRIGILTAGGDSPGLNAAIRGVGKAAIGTYNVETRIRKADMEGFQVGLMYRENLALEGLYWQGGARVGYVNPDETTFAYLKGREFAPQGAAWDAAVADWSTLRTDDGATFDTEVFIDATTLRPHVSWGTNPGQVLPIDGAVPSPADFDDVVATATPYLLPTSSTAPRSPRRSTSSWRHIVSMLKSRNEASASPMASLLRVNEVARSRPSLPRQRQLN